MMTGNSLIWQSECVRKWNLIRLYSPDFSSWDRRIRRSDTKSFRSPIDYWFCWSSLETENYFGWRFRFAARTSLVFYNVNVVFLVCFKMKKKKQQQKTAFTLAKMTRKHRLRWSPRENNFTRKISTVYIWKWFCFRLCWEWTFLQPYHLKMWTMNIKAYFYWWKKYSELFVDIFLDIADNENATFFPHQTTRN